MNLQNGLMSQTYQGRSVVHAELKLEKALHAKHHAYGTKPRIKPGTDVARCTAAYPQDQKQKQDGKLSGTV